MSAGVSLPITGRCYCGTITVTATKAPDVVAYCHCVDCRRVTGAPVSAFAAFSEAALTFVPDEGHSVSPTAGVSRSFCGACGSPLASRFDYLPGQVYIPLGLIDQADVLQPQMHSYESQRLPWLHIEDDAERFERSSRARLNAAGGSVEAAMLERGQI